MNTKFSVAASGFFTTLLIASLANAGNLGQFDARSLAMGGAGVAGAQSANAAAYNPALMATDSNKKSVSFIFPVISLQAVDENDFIDTIDATEESLEGDGGLNDLLDGLTITDEDTTDCNCFTHPNMTATAAKSDEVFNNVTSLNKSNALVGANTGIAIQLGRKIPMAFIVDGGADLRVGVKFANSDFKELNAYSDAMADGQISSEDFDKLQALGLIETTPGELNFLRGDGGTQELQSLIEVTGAAYYEFGLSFADSFQYFGKDLAIGITPKVVKVSAVKYHQSVEQDGDSDIEVDDILDDDNLVNKTGFNADVGVVFKPLDSQPLQVGVTLKNLFTRSYELKKTPQELAIETAANGNDPIAKADAIADLATFNFTQTIKIEPQITAGIAYDLRFFNLLADIDLNEAEVLGRTTQHLALGAEFDARLVRLQLGYRTSIGGDDEADVLSAGTSLGPLGIAAVFAEDNIGGVIQFGMSF